MMDSTIYSLRPATEYKECKVCKERKAFSSFSLDKKRTDGRRVSCKACRTKKATSKTKGSSERYYDRFRYET